MEIKPRKLDMFVIWEQEDLSFQISLLSNNTPSQTQAMDDNSRNIKITLCPPAPQNYISTPANRLAGNCHIESLLFHALALELNACSNLQKTRT